MSVLNNEVRTIEGEVDEAIPPRFRNFPWIRFYASVAFMLTRFLFLVFLLNFAVSLLVSFPDIDFTLSPLLRHRSIVTHSVLIPGLLLAAFWKFGLAKSAVSVLLAAMSVHLFADVLSPPVGYGQIWLPIATDLSLGVFSPIWLFVNGMAAAILSIHAMAGKFRSELLFATLLSGTLYGLAHEQSLLSTIFIVAMLLASYLYPLKKNWIQETPQSIIGEMTEARDISIAEKARHTEAKRIEREKIGKVRRLALGVGSVFVSAYICIRWVVLNPIKALGSAAATAGILATFYFVGVSGNISETGSISATAAHTVSGAAQAIGNGVWVLHSSGGYILKQGGQYVAGTLRDSLPD